MFRLLPPRGRALVVAAMCMALLPSAALAADITVPEQVTGRSALVIIVPPVKGTWTVTVTAADDRTASWEGVAEDQRVTVNLAAPDDGFAPINGTAQVAVTGPRGLTASSDLVIDLDPASPSLTTVVRGQRVGVNWDPVTGPGPVTYLLERASSGSTWDVLARDTSTVGYTDRNLEPGRYRYRLTALAPSADGDVNASKPVADQIRIAAPPPPPRAEAPTVAAPTPPKLPDPPKDKTRQAKGKPRNVAATGGVRGPVRADGQPQRRSAPGTSSSTITAEGPRISSASAPADGPPPVAPPTAAPPAPSSLDSSPLPHGTAAPPEVAAPPMPVMVPPVGALAVEASAGHRDDAVVVLVAFGFLGLALTFGRRRLWTRSAPSELGDSAVVK